MFLRHPAAAGADPGICSLPASLVRKGKGLAPSRYIPAHAGSATCLFSVDPLPSLFAHTVPEIFSLWTIFTLQRKDIDPQSRMFVFSILVQLIKQCIFICITQKKSGETAVILHRFQSSAQLWFFVKDIFKPGHITGLHINIIACRIHGKRALRYRTEGKIRRKIICDLIFSAYDIYFF